jgi:hypothetical protein
LRAVGLGAARPWEKAGRRDGVLAARLAGCRSSWRRAWERKGKRGERGAGGARTRVGEWRDQGVAAASREEGLGAAGYRENGG